MTLRLFDLSIHYALDLGVLIDSRSKLNLLSLRSSGELFERLIKGIEGTKTNGAFHLMGREEEMIKAQVERSLSLGGKNIFSATFFEQYAPYWLKDDRDLPLSKLVKRASEETITAGDLELDMPNQSMPICTYKGCEMRLFRDGILSIRFSFCNVNDDTYIPVEQFIDILRQIRSQTYLAFQDRIAKISSDWANDSHPIQKSTGLKIIECDLSSVEMSMRSVVSEYKVLIIDTMYVKNSSSWESKAVDTLEKERILGLVNLAPWFKQYSNDYITQCMSRSLGYKNNELFLCDGTSSLIVLPEYWSKPRLQNYLSYLVLLSELLNAQLSFIQATGSSIETDILLKPIQKGGVARETINEALLSKGLILQMEKTGDVDSLVTHGFTREYLELIQNELNIPKRIGIIHRRMLAVDARLTLESEHRSISKGLSLDRIGLAIALLALVLTLLCQLLQLILQISGIALSG